MSALVSTIIPVHNRPQMLRDAVDSVLAQTHRPIEIIIVDDHSTDNTYDIAQALSERHKEVSIASARNRGPGAARETGRILAKGDFIQYLDSDDILLPKKFSQQIAQFEKQPEAQVCYGKEVRRGADYVFSSYDEFDNETAIKSTGKEISAIFPDILYGSLWGTSVPLWRKKLVDQLGNWLSLINEEDTEYDARAGANNALLTQVPEFVAVQRVHDDHLSSDGTSDPEKLKHRVLAREKILEHALASGLTVGCDGLKHFSKSTFLLARMCAKQALKDEMDKALKIAMRAAGGVSSRVRFYQLASKLVGQKTIQSYVERLERLRGDK